MLSLPCPRKRTKNAGRHLCGLTLPVNRAIIVERFEKAATHGPVAQLGERRVRIAEAEGSNPFGSTRTETPVSCLKLGLFLCLSGFFATLVLSLFACFCGCLSIFVREKFVKINRPPSPRLWGGGVLLYRGKLAGGGAFGCVPTCLFSICYNVQGGRRAFSAAPGRPPLLWHGPLRADGAAVRRRYKF